MCTLPKYRRRLIHDRNVGESEIHNDSWSEKTRRILCKENDDLDQNQEKSEQESERGWEQPIGMLLCYISMCTFFFLRSILDI